MQLSLFHKNGIMQRMISEKTQEMKIFFDKEGKIIFCNSKALQELGYGAEIYKHTINEIFRSTFYYEGNKLCFLNNENDKYVEAVAYRQNQTCFPVRLNISTYQRKKKGYGLCMAICTESIKEANRKIIQLQNEIDTLNKKRNEITANITHELRTPVNGIMGLSDNLLDMDLNPAQTEVVQLIKHCCNNMNAMINSFLDYAKITNEKMILEQREFDLGACINTIIESNKPRINEKGLKLLVYISDDIPKRVIGDELRLTQILNNLLSNAVKFTVIGQVALELVKLSETERDVELFFMIIDTGIGISNEDKDKLFQSFSQVDSSITRRFGGTGLGLAISKKLVEAMGGSISLESEKDKGSTFSFTVHLALPEGSSENRNRIGRQVKTGFDTIYPTGKELLDQKLAPGRQEPQGGWSKEEFKRKLAPLLEKLSICIEMESWDKAEELAYYMKKQMPSGQNDIEKKVFRLLLAVRKEKYDIAFIIINELKVYIDER